MGLKNHAHLTIDHTHQVLCWGRDHMGGSHEGWEVKHFNQRNSNVFEVLTYQTKQRKHY